MGICACRAPVQQRSRAFIETTGPEQKPASAVDHPAMLTGRPVTEEACAAVLRAHLCPYRGTCGDNVRRLGGLAESACRAKRHADEGRMLDDASSRSSPYGRRR